MEVLTRIFDFMIDYGAIISFGISFLSICMYYILGDRYKRNFLITSGALLTIATGLSFKYYLIQASTFYLTALYPVSLPLIILIIRSDDNSRSGKVRALYVMHSLLLLIGIQFLNAGANTWGNFGVWIGVFMTTNSVLILLFITFLSFQNLFYGITRFVTGLVSISILVYRGWIEPRSPYDGDFELLMAHVSLGFAVLLVLEGLLLIFSRPRQVCHELKN